MRAFITAVVLALLPAAVQAQTAHCLFGCPKGASPANQVINRSIYVLSNNPETKFADWVAYRLNPSIVNGPKPPRGFKTDTDLLPSNTILKSEYSHASVALGVDRGHQAPLASFKGSPDVSDTNLLSNVTPQFTKLNQGAWKELEEAVRDLVNSHPGGQVFVMTGPLYEWPMAKLPDTDKDHDVPSAYWKIVALQETTQVSVAAFYFYQDTPQRADFCDHMKTVRFIERKSHLDFFSGMPDAEEEAFETSQATLVAGLGC